MPAQVDLTFNQFLPRIQTDLNQRLPIGAGFLVIAIILRFIFKVPVPNFIFYFLLWIILTYFLLHFIFKKFFDRKPTYIVYTYFCFLLLDLILLTGVVYYLGSITWVAPAFYLFYIISAPWIFPFKLAAAQIIFASLIFIILVVSQTLNIIPQTYFFSIQDKESVSFTYFLTTLIVAESTFVFLAFSAYNFQELVAQKIEELARTNQKLSATGEFLKKEILKQTKQLREEKDRLAEIVAQKTADLEEKNIILQKRSSELEKFYRKSVERELKIAKLKEELSKLSQS